MAAPLTTGVYSTLPRLYLVWAGRAARPASRFQNERSAAELHPDMGDGMGIEPMSSVSQTNVLAAGRPIPWRCWGELNPRLLR